MSVVVVGATGVIGSRTVANLIHRGEKVTAVARSAERAYNLPGGAVVQIADLRDPDAATSALAGASRVVLVPVNGPDQSALEQNVIEASAAAGVEHVVKVSVGGAAEDAAISFAREHWAAEQRLDALGVPRTIVRPGFFMQNLLNYVHWIDADGVLALPVGEGAIAMIDADDVAEALTAVVLGDPGSDVVITGPEALTMTDALMLLSEAAGRSLTYADGTPEVFRSRLVSEGASDKYAQDLTVLYDRVIRAGYTGRVTHDFADLVGRPPTAFRQFAERSAVIFAA